MVVPGWISMAIMSAMQIGKVETWPGDMILTGDNRTSPIKFVSKSAVDTYFACTWAASLIALLFGVFKCRSMADVLFGLSEADAQLELKEKHYEKIKRKSLYWILFLTCLLAIHGLAFTFMVKDIFAFIDDKDPDILLILADVVAHATIFVLDLQFLHLSMVLCKRYRMINKLLLHVAKPWKTFRTDQPPNYVLQNLLQYRFDQVSVCKHGLYNVGIRI